MNYIKVKIYIINKIKKLRKIDNTFWNLKEIRYCCTKKEYIFYKKYIYK